MLRKIKQMSWTEWGIVSAAAILVLALPALINYLLGNHPTIGLSPWSGAVAIENEIALEEFKTGQTLDHMFIKERISSFIGILLFYIIGPGLLILNGLGSSSDENGYNIPFKTGLTLVLTGILIFGFSNVVQTIVRQNTHESTANSKKEDQMRQDILEISQASYQYYVLPDSLGGNGGSFAGITLDSIDVNLNSPSSTYRLQAVSDTLLKITGASSYPYPSEKGKDSIDLEAHSHPNNIIIWKDSY